MNDFFVGILSAVGNRLSVAQLSARVHESFDGAATACAVR